MWLIHKHRKTEKQSFSNKKWSYSKQDFSRVFNLLNDLDWIRLRESQLNELLYGLLKEEEERNLLEELLRKVVYLDDNDSRAKVKDIANVILNVWQCSPMETAIVGAKKKDTSDGGDILIYNLRNYLGWPESRLRTSYKGLNSFNNVKTIIVADDFIGTGKRMHDVIVDINSMVPGVRIKYVAIGMMVSVVKELYPDILTYEYFAPISLSPGMNHKEAKKVSMMTQIEAYLAPR